jgi:hypothetical protein
LRKFHQIRQQIPQLHEIDKLSFKTKSREKKNHIHYPSTKKCIKHRKSCRLPRSRLNIPLPRANDLSTVIERIKLLAFLALVPDTAVVLGVLLADLRADQPAVDALVDGSQRHDLAWPERAAAVVAFFDFAAAAHVVCSFVGVADPAGHAAEVVDFEVFVPFVGPFDGG